MATNWDYSSFDLGDDYIGIDGSIKNELLEKIKENNSLDIFAFFKNKDDESRYLLLDDSVYKIVTVNSNKDNITETFDPKKIEEVFNKRSEKLLELLKQKYQKICNPDDGIINNEAKEFVDGLCGDNKPLSIADEICGENESSIIADEICGKNESSNIADEICGKNESTTIASKTINNADNYDIFVLPKEQAKELLKIFKEKLKIENNESNKTLIKNKIFILNIYLKEYFFECLSNKKEEINDYLKDDGILNKYKEFIKSFDKQNLLNLIETNKNNYKTLKSNGQLCYFNTSLQTLTSDIKFCNFLVNFYSNFISDNKIDYNINILILFYYIGPIVFFINEYFKPDNTIIDITNFLAIIIKCNKLFKDTLSETDKQKIFDNIFKEQFDALEITQYIIDQTYYIYQAYYPHESLICNFDFYLYVKINLKIKIEYVDENNYINLRKILKNENLFNKYIDEDDYKKNNNNILSKTTQEKENLLKDTFIYNDLQNKGYINLSSYNYEFSELNEIISRYLINHFILNELYENNNKLQQQFYNTESIDIIFPSSLYITPSNHKPNNFSDSLIIDNTYLPDTTKMNEEIKKKYKISLIIKGERLIDYITLCLCLKQKKESTNLEQIINKKDFDLDHIYNLNKDCGYINIREKFGNKKNDVSVFYNDEQDKDKKKLKIYLREYYEEYYGKITERFVDNIITNSLYSTFIQGDLLNYYNNFVKNYKELKDCRNINLFNKYRNEIIDFVLRKYTKESLKYLFIKIMDITIDEQIDSNEMTYNSDNIKYNLKCCKDDKIIDVRKINYKLKGVQYKSGGTGGGHYIYLKILHDTKYILLSDTTLVGEYNNLQKVFEYINKNNYQEKFIFYEIEDYTPLDASS